MYCIVPCQCIYTCSQLCKRACKPRLQCTHSTMREIIALFMHRVLLLAGLMHRDLKPDNFLLTSNPDAAASLKVADFGCSALLPLGATLTDIVGNVHYRAPEVQSGTYAFAAEMWSLGVTLHNMLSGSMPCRDSAGQSLPAFPSNFAWLLQSMLTSCTVQTLSMLNCMVLYCTRYPYNIPLPQPTFTRSLKPSMPTMVTLQMVTRKETTSTSICVQCRQTADLLSKSLARHQ